MTKETISRQLDLAWLAGIIEGEGSIEVGFTNHYNEKHQVNYRHLFYRIKVSNNDPRLIQKASKIFKTLKVTFCYRICKRKDRNYWTMGLICAGRKSCEKLINAVYPYLYSKIDQADMMLEAIKYREEMGFSRKPGTPLISEDKKLLGIIEKLKWLKRNHPEASETRRHANQVLEILD